MTGVCLFALYLNWNYHRKVYLDFYLESFSRYLVVSCFVTWQMFISMVFKSTVFGACISTSVEWDILPDYLWLVSSYESFAEIRISVNDLSILFLSEKSSGKNTWNVNIHVNFDCLTRMGMYGHRYLVRITLLQWLTVCSGNSCTGSSDLDRSGL